MSHWHKVFTCRKYRGKWLFTIGATVSSLFCVTFIGGQYGGTVSAEIERRRVLGKKLGFTLRFIKFAGGYILGHDHWEISYYREEYWRKTRDVQNGSGH